MLHASTPRVDDSAGIRFPVCVFHPHLKVVCKFLCIRLPRLDLDPLDFRTILKDYVDLGTRAVAPEVDIRIESLVVALLEWFRHGERLEEVPSVRMYEDLFRGFDAEQPHGKAGVHEVEFWTFYKTFPKFCDRA